MKTINLTLTLSDRAVALLEQMAKDGGLLDKVEDEAALSVAAALTAELAYRGGNHMTHQWSEDVQCEVFNPDTVEGFAKSYDLLKDFESPELEDIKLTFNEHEITGARYMELCKDGPVRAFGLDWYPVELMPTAWWYGYAGAEHGQWFTSITRHGITHDIFYSPATGESTYTDSEQRVHTIPASKVSIEEYRFSDEGDDFGGQRFELASTDWSIHTLPDEKR